MDVLKANELKKITMIRRGKGSVYVLSDQR